MTDEDVRRDLDRLERRIEQMDTHGTRGVGIVQSQLADVIKDLAKLEGRMAEHDRVHVREERDRASNRRWMVTTAIGFLVLLVAILALLIGQHGT